MVESKTEEAEAQQLLGICTNYLVGLAMETKRKELPKSNVAEQVEVSKDHRYYCDNVIVVMLSVVIQQTSLCPPLKVSQFQSCYCFTTFSSTIGGFNRLS